MTVGELRMIQNRMAADAFTIGLTIYAPYPDGAFANDIMRKDDFHEWYRRDGAGMGAAGFRGAAGQMYLAVKAFRTWAAKVME